MTQHTQGEWVVSDARMAPGGICGRYIAHKDGGMIADAFFNCRVNSVEELEANARLIAAAPHLLATLEMLLATVDQACKSALPPSSFKGARMAAHIALAKATGSAA